ncbi:MAG TPA: hypothetical protein VFQ65_33920 [Kofleriaceae bacterium]|nr:hypothetical protein [Kofleriaceae bacterium]
MGGRAGAKVTKRGVVKTAPRLSSNKKSAKPKAAKPKADAKSKAKAAKSKPATSAKHAATVASPAPRRSQARGDRIAITSRDEKLGEVTAPSGKLAIFDVGLFPFLPRDTLEPALVTCEAPARALPVLGRRVGAGRFAECWDYVAVRFSPHPVASSRKLGEAGVDFARLMIIDYAALAAWQHEDSLDGKADLMFWGRDAALAARRITAPPTREGYGWTNLTVAAATAKWDQLERVKAENHWLLASDLRPHSHHFHALSAARASKQGAGTVAVGGATALLFFTSWGDGVFPIYLDSDADDRPVQLRVQLNTAESNAALRAVNR